MKTGNTPVTINLHDQARKAAFEKKIKENPSNVTVLWGYSKLLFKLNDIESTITILREIISISPKNFDAGLLLIDCLAKTGKQEEALHHAHKMEGWYPQNSRLLRKLVVILADANDEKSARSYLDKLVKLWPSQSDTWVAKAEYLTLTGKRIEAIKAWEKAYHTDKTNAKAQLYLGIDACVTEQFERAETLLSNAVTGLKGKEPENTLGRYYLAYCYKRRNPEDMRVINFIRMTDAGLLDLENKRIRHNMAEMWETTARHEFDHKNYAGAVIYLEKVEAYEPDMVNPDLFARMYFAYAEWCHEKKIRQRALKYAEKALQLDPDSSLYKEKYNLYRKDVRAEKLKERARSIPNLKKPVLVLLIVIIGWLAFPYLEEPGTWYLARIQNNIDAYDSYLKKYPDGQYIQAAIEKGEKALWEEIRDAPSVLNCDLYLTRFPEGEYVSQVLDKKEDAVWNAALEKNTIDAYFEYFEAYPNGKYNVRIDESGNNSLTDITSRSGGNTDVAYVKATMRGTNGYTNIREGKGTQHAVIAKVYKDQAFFVQPIKGQNWWKVILADGTKGFIHKSRVKKN